MIALEQRISIVDSEELNVYPPFALSVNLNLNGSGVFEINLAIYVGTIRVLQLSLKSGTGQFYTSTVESGSFVYDSI